ncbi:unnamed protein product [Onchocerca ochengi]|uniref:Schwannomin interacting protein 1 C-terminal domain-containing protein n=1 Tax=Onchocerca ochengi TaxID=42157 RepID=A0A182E1V3_ONCOC|nr:unnamed protein product [Onchocerca ochengi]
MMSMMQQPLTNLSQDIGYFIPKSMNDSNIQNSVQKSNDKSIFGQSNAQCVTYPQLSTKDFAQLQFDDSTIKQSNDTRGFSFKKVSPVASESSFLSTINEEIPEMNEENTSDYDMDSLEEIASVKILSSSSPRSRNSSRSFTTNNSTEMKSTDFEIISYANNSNSSSNSSRVSIPPPIKQSTQAKQYVSRSVIHDINISEIKSDTLSSTTRTSENHKSYHYGAEEHKREKKLKHLEEKQKHRDSDNTHSTRLNKLNSGSIQKYESRSSCSESSRSSQESSVLNKSSYKYKNRSTIIDTNHFADNKCHVDDLAKSEQFDISSHPVLRRKNFLADFDNSLNKTKLDGKKCKNVAVQTVHLEQNCDLLPMFTPLLLKDIEENMKEMSEREAVSTIIQTHVDLIKRQAQREKRMLEEWDSAISDLEERCQFVNFERLKLLLHSNDYFYAF